MNRFVTVLVLLLLVIGCSKGTSVKGKVVFEDGTPLTRGEVRFVEGNKMFSGTVQKDGTFVMMGATPNAGIDKGTYQVSIAGAFEMESGGADDEYGKSKPLIAAKFSNPETSDLTCTVKGNETVEFKVSPP